MQIKVTVNAGHSCVYFVIVPFDLIEHSMNTLSFTNFRNIASWFIKNSRIMIQTK